MSRTLTIYTKPSIKFGLNLSHYKITASNFCKPFSVPHIWRFKWSLFNCTQLTVADLPGLIPDSHKNKGLGIQFLKHAERCLALIYIVDISSDDAASHLDILNYELSQFSSSLKDRPALVVANKIDVEGSEENVEMLKQSTDLPVIPISAKMGTNVKLLLYKIREIYDEHNDNKDDEE